MSATSHPVSQFFTSFADIGFTHQSTAPLVPEFARLRKMAKWSKAEAWEIRGQFYDAVADEFGFLFGTDLGNLEQLQRLCELVHIHPAPDTVKESKKMLKRVFVNIYDLIDTERIGKELRLFEREADLSHYTVQSGLVYPLHKAKGRLMQYMLRRIYHPRQRPATAA